MTVSAALGNVSELFSYAIGMAGEVMSFITSQPILGLFLLTPFVGIGVGLIRRIIRL